MNNVVSQKFNKRFSRWLDRRIPPRKSFTLDQKKIFIFPSKTGAWFFLLLFIMLLAAINYQNNMSFALVFLLTSVFIIAILHTFANLSGLTIKAGQVLPVFAEDIAEIELQISRPGKKHYFDVNFRWPESENCSVTLTELNAQTINLHVPVVHRGWYKPNRLLVESFYPIGLLRCWTWLALDVSVLVYPKPIQSTLDVKMAADAIDEGEVIPVVGSEDFYEFKRYQAGDSPKHVFWKSYAKGQELQTKQYAGYREQRVWLNWDDFSGDTEERLSKLCYWVLQLHAANDEYGLKIPGIEIPPAHGDHHRAEVLKSLALFQVPELAS